MKEKKIFRNENWKMFDQKMLFPKKKDHLSTGDHRQKQMRKTANVGRTARFCQ